MKMTISPLSLNTLGMPLLGFGTYQMSSEQAEVSVVDAMKAGFRHIDSAEGYSNEDGTGRGIQKGLEEAGLQREELFVTTKLFPGYQPWGAPDKTYEQTLENLKTQLKHLRLDYVDLYLIHGPMSGLRLDQWRAFIELKHMGLTRHIGVSNYHQAQIEEITDAGLDLPEANQIEFHPICAQVALRKYMSAHDIAPIAYSPLAPLSGWRTEEGQGGEVLAELKTEAQRVIKDIADKLGVAEAKLLLRWGLQHGFATLTKSTKPERIRENLNVFDFEIPHEDMQRLDQLDQNQTIAWAANGIDAMEAVPLK